MAKRMNEFRVRSGIDPRVGSPVPLWSVGPVGRKRRQAVESGPEPGRATGSTGEGMSNPGILLRILGGVLAMVALANVLSVAASGSEPTAALSFLVLKEDNGKPIRNAAVVLHPVNAKGKQGRGGFELKTDADGKTHFEGVPYGKMRVQVLAPGFQTYGEDFDIGEPEKTITITLKRPQKQFSIYENAQGAAKKDAPEEKK